MSIKRPFTCPCCEGEGGWGDGYYEPVEYCTFCHAQEKVGPLRRLRWWWFNSFLPVSVIEWMGERKAQQEQEHE